MSSIELIPFAPHGAIEAPPSKSVAHRLMIATALAGGHPARDVRLGGTPSQDITATIACLQALATSDTPLLDCGESGSTLRFLLPIAAALGKAATFIGRGRLPERPIDTLLELFARHGVTASSPHLPLTLNGCLQPGTFTLPGNVSSQFVTGLLFALPLLDAPARIHVTTPLESLDYIKITLDTLKHFGLDIQTSPDYKDYSLAAPSRYVLPQELPLLVEGDWSNAAFPLAAGALGGNGVTVRGLNPASPQGDRAILALLAQFGARIDWTAPDACAIHPAPLQAIPEIDARPIPDLVPILAVVAGLAHGTTTFTHVARLRIKESDRLETTAQLLRSLGGKAETTPDTLRVTGVSQYTSGTVDSCNDHRIAMAAAIAATRAAGTVTLQKPTAVQKSWPDFFTALESLR